jgi:hypothetical protein
MSKNSEHIQNFIARFDARADEIVSLVESDRSHILKKILFTTLLDGLNKVIAKTMGEKDDLSHFVINYGDWSAARKISLPHFRAELRRGTRIDTSDLSVESLLKAVDNKYSVWLSTIDSPFNEPEDVGLIAFRDDDEMQLHALSVENDINEDWIKNFCSLDKIEPLNTWFRHANMLKKYRNCLVHESRQMGVKNRPERFDMPHYEHICVRLRETLRMEMYFNLVYPYGFFYNLTKNAIKNVREKLIENKLNPFDAWPKQEIYWIDEFNSNTLLPPY